MLRSRPNPAASDTTVPSPRVGWLPWWRRSTAASGSAAATEAHEPPARVAQHEAERRRRMAASAAAPLDRALARTSAALFKSVTQIDELAARTQAGASAQDSIAAMRVAQERMIDALLHCDQLAILLDHMQLLLAPAPPAHQRLDLRQLLSLATYCARGLLPGELVIVNRVPALPTVTGDRAALMQAFIDALVQMGSCVRAGGQLELDGGNEQGIVWIGMRACGVSGSPRPGLALESAIETMARHRGALEPCTDRSGTHALRLRLPAAH